ncbi:unnamed protein product [Pocillopora meandrina]|uniref:Uncharacterized protein n=1 Tax=Pocillopora meandrina TaxID=46732 RepID=A0AAU9WHF6_9CNID|nr:unnamed protein product [Pocillopora meandrina]
MAGQCECYSHIASVLFYIGTFDRLRGKLACTDLKCAWSMSSYVKDVPYAEVEDIDFRSAKKLKQKLDVSIDKLDATSDKTPASDTKRDIKRNLDFQAESPQTK